MDCFLVGCKPQIKKIYAGNQNINTEFLFFRLCSMGLYNTVSVLTPMNNYCCITINLWYIENRATDPCAAHIKQTAIRRLQILQKQSCQLALHYAHHVHVTKTLKCRLTVYETFATFPLRKCVSNKVSFDNYVLRKKSTFVESELI